MSKDAINVVFSRGRWRMYTGNHKKPTKTFSEENEEDAILYARLFFNNHIKYKLLKVTGSKLHQANLRIERKF